MSAIRSLLANIVDYAGLFPPASLPLESVIENFAEYMTGDDRWMLARIIVPALRLKDFERITVEHMKSINKPSGDVWLVSALMPKLDDHNFNEALNSISDFNNFKARNFSAKVDTIEIAAGRPGDIEQIAETIPQDINTFIEIPHADPFAHFDKLRNVHTYRANISAKIRTGGVKAELIPPIEQVADFIWASKQAGVSFKATAGLHHPIRNEFPLTYENNSLRGTMHGFLNVFVAACLVDQQSINRDQLIAILSENQSTSFSCSGSSLSWREFTIEKSAIEATRTSFAISFGSCSFEEPLADLRTMGQL